MDPTTRARRFSAALRPIVSAMNLPIPAGLNNNDEYLWLAVLERVAGDAELLAMLRQRFAGPAGPIPDAAPPAPPHVINKQWQTPPEPAKT